MPLLEHTWEGLATQKLRSGQAAYPRVGWGTQEDESAAMTGFQQRHHYAESSGLKHDRTMTFWSFSEDTEPVIRISLRRLLHW